MDAKQIVRYIDDGANFYLQMFGNAEHMEYVDNGYYSYVKPKDGEKGITFVFHIRLNNESLEVQRDKMTEIKALGMPIWLDLLASDDLYLLTFESEKEHGKTILEDSDEAYMAILPHERLSPLIEANLTVVKVETKDQFNIWTQLANDLLGGGNPDMHPYYHYPLIQKGLITCYIGYIDGVPAAVSSIFNNESIDSLELVATIPEYRRQGLARAVCRKAIDDAFENGARIITLRAISSGAISLYESLGFKIYNFAI